MTKEAADADAASAKRGTDPLKAYTVVFAVLSLFIGFLYLKMSGEQREYAQANADAPRLLSSSSAPTGSDQRPTTLYALGVDIQKYLATLRESKISPNEVTGIPAKLIADRMTNAGIGYTSAGGEQKQRFAAKGPDRGAYEETKIQYSLEPATVDQFAKLLYNIEGSSTSLRVLELSWALRTGKDLNPYPPGDAIQSETFTIGFRRPLVAR